MPAMQGVKTCTACCAPHSLNSTPFCCSRHTSPKPLTACTICSNETATRTASSYSWSPQFSKTTAMQPQRHLADDHFVDTSLLASEPCTQRHPTPICADAKRTTLCSPCRAGQKCSTWAASYAWLAPSVDPCQLGHEELELCIGTLTVSSAARIATSHFSRDTSCCLRGTRGAETSPSLPLYR